MRVAPVAAILLRQWYLLRGSPVRALPMFAWVGIDIVLWGFISRFLDSVSAAGIDFTAVLLGAVLLWDLCARVMQGLTTAFLEDVWSRNFLNLFASPLRISEYVTGLVLASIATSLIGLAVMLALAVPVFGLSFLALGLPLLLFLLVLYAFGVALGILASGMVLRFGPASEWLVWPIPALLSPFCAVFYPLTILPAWMRAVAHALPPSYVFEGMRALLDGRPFALLPALGALALAALEIVLAGSYFVHVYRRAVRTGLLARYSAETVS
ncbi:MAG TPA: ABC transporter permease [Steroidobacteraceae bacterium]|nr:ABC transporter permease [Steroidobacteraceae bacterium]